MKKLCILFSVIALSLCFCACNKKSNEETIPFSQGVDNKNNVMQLNTKDFTEKVCDINIENGQKVFKYKGDKPCIVDFYATWCGPCKKQSPIIDELAEKYAGKVYFYKVDVDEAKEIALHFGIRSIPTLIFCSKDNGATGLQGLQNKETIEEMIETYLLSETMSSENED